MTGISRVSCLPRPWRDLGLCVPLAGVCGIVNALALWKLLRFSLDIPRAWQLHSEFHRTG